MPRYISPQVQYFDSLGVPLNAGKLFFYEPSTLVLKNTYSDSSLAVPNTNPVILAVNGSPSVDIWLNGTYRVILKDSLDNVIWDKDPVGGDNSDRVPWTNWVSGITYDTGNVVVASNDRYYVAIQEPNLNQDPTTSPAWWSEIRLLRVYNASETYPANTVIQDTSGFLWRSKVLTAGAAPVLGSAFWEPAIDGFAALSDQSTITNIASGALAKNRFYRLTAAGPFTLPLASTTNSGDKIFIVHDPDVEPAVNASGGDVIRFGTTVLSAANYTGVVLNVGFSCIFVSNGTRWELN
jgi:hypothetical protein